MGRGNRVQLLRLLGMEGEWVRARHMNRSDGEWGCRHGRRVLSSGVCPCKDKKEEGGGGGQGGSQ
jgi:hypothetical protein